MNTKLNNGCRLTDAEVVRFEDWAVTKGMQHRLLKSLHTAAWSYRHLPTQFAFVGWTASLNYPRPASC